ncbi:MAG: DUF302 domain-containing protein [Candidatus Thiodiazotropha sp. (ex Monitilora ramsayi)]|nr:DUF302 domain-containing protein [Candidatus Thiodiazotropha sp. (ex Monitilora ramsayi)]
MYEINTEIDLPFAQALEKVRDTLTSEHLGIQRCRCAGDLQGKNGKDIPAYHIYGACNPRLAERVLSSENPMQVPYSRATSSCVKPKAARRWSVSWTRSAC